MCSRSGGKPHFSRLCPALIKKMQQLRKVGHFSQKCRSKPQPNSGKYNKQNNFCGEENVFSEKTSPASEIEFFLLKTKAL